MLWNRKKGDRRKNRRLEEGIWPMGQIPSSNPFLFTINGILLNWNTGILFNWNKHSSACLAPNPPWLCVKKHLRDLLLPV